MSLSQEAEYSCSECGEAFTVSVWLTVNSVLSPELKEEILNGTLNLIRCPHCGATGQSSQPLLYHDMEKHVMFYVSSAGDEAARRQAEKQVREIIATLPGDAPHKTAAKVLRNMRDLRRMVDAMDAAQNPDGTHVECAPEEWIDLAEAILMAPMPWPLDHTCICGEAIPTLCLCREPGSPINIAKYEPNISPALTIRCWKCWRKLSGFSCVKCSQVYQWSLGVVEKLTPCSL